MPDDRFDDFGPERPKRSAAERFEEEDRLRPEPDMPRPPEPRRAGNKYAWVVGILLLMGIGVLLLTTAIPNSGAGINGPAKGGLLPAFAAPLPDSDFPDDRDDANVFQNQKAAKSAGADHWACQVESPQVLNSCRLRDKASVITFLVTKGTDCEPQVDRVERVKKDFPQVNFAVVMSGNKRDEAKQISENRRWTQPVGVDEDGAIVNLYGIGVCPSTVFAYPGGKVRTTTLGNLTEDELRTEVRRTLKQPPAPTPTTTG